MRSDVKGNKEQLYFDNYNPSDLENAIEAQRKIIKIRKAAKRTKLFSVLVVIDDFADDPMFTRQSKLLHSLFTRGRHNCIWTIVSAHKFASIHPVVRVNAVALVVYRLRNNKEVESFLEEVSGLSGKKELLAIYKAATDDEYSFQYVNLAARKVSEMFYKNLTGRIELEDETNDWYFYFQQ